MIAEVVNTPFHVTRLLSYVYNISIFANIPQHFCYVFPDEDCTVGKDFFLVKSTFFHLNKKEIQYSPNKKSVKDMLSLIGNMLRIHCKTQYLESAMKFVCMYVFK